MVSMYASRFLGLLRNKRAAAATAVASASGLVAGLTWSPAEHHCQCAEQAPPLPATAQSYAGKTLIITGAGGNFGRAGALYFSRLGANVIATDVAADGA